MKLLMHICCAPCANMPIDALRAAGIDLTGYWYNPNIHPFTEYRARRNCLQEYAKTIDLPLVMQDEYALRPFIRAVAEDIDGRCVKCYELRLYAAAQAAKDGGFDAFTSSLLSVPIRITSCCATSLTAPPRKRAHSFITRTSAPCSVTGKPAPASWASISKNTAAASFPNRNGIRKQVRSFDKQRYSSQREGLASPLRYD